MTDRTTGPSGVDVQRHLAEAARAANRAVRVSTVDDEAKARAADLLREAATLLESGVHPGPHCQVGFAGAQSFDGELAPHQFFPYSPVIGPFNPLSPPVELEVQEDRTVRGRMVLHEGYNGPPWNLAHGGVIAAVFDELLGVAGIVAAGGGFTGRLTIHYRKPTPILEEVELAAWLEAVEGRKLLVRGEMRHQGAVTAEAEGLFIQVGGPLADAEGAPEGAPPGGG